MLRVLIAAVMAGASLISVAIAQEAQGPALPATPGAWRAAAEADLEALRTYLREDTPIALDAENPSMQRWYERGYREARGRVRRVSDQAGYYYALLGYANGFHDPHLSLGAQMRLATASWPGFVTTADGDDVVVFSRDEDDPNTPALGALVISCDGRSPAAFRARNIYPFTLNPGLAGDRRRSATRMFMDRHNPFGPTPRRCVFDEDGARRTITLTWRDVPDGNAYWDQYGLASLGPAASFDITAPAAGVTWIGVPTLDNGAGEQLQALINEITAQAPAIRAGRAVVIDVRGNGGGNSEWGVRIARALWGDDIINSIPGDDRPGAVDWRASPGNRDYIAGLTPELAQQFGTDSDIVQWAHRAHDGIEAAIGRGDAFWRDRDPGETGEIAASGGYAQERPTGPSLIPARVYVLSNGVCASACLDMSDIILHIPGVQLIGADTSGDGLLMEIRSVTLPSGLVQLGLPMKVYRGRGRGSLESYHTDVAYGGVWSDEAVRAWVMQLIEAQ
ncbi:MAG: S41 family peptidase [Hyphomonadaceae bacterium]